MEKTDAKQDGDGFLKQYAETYRFSLGRPTAITVAGDGQAVLLLRSGPRSFVRDLFEFDLATRKERVLVTAGQLLKGADEKLSAEELARRERMRLAARGIASYDVSEDGRRVLVPLGEKLFVVEHTSGAVRELPSQGGFPLDPRFSRDGQQVACVREGELYAIDVASAAQRQLTTGAGGSVTHGLAEFVAQEEMDRPHGYWWSPDGKWLAYQRTDTKNVENLYIADSIAPDRPAQGWPYPRPGKNNADVRLGIVPADGGATTWIVWDTQRYPYLAKVTWDENAPLTILVQNRTQTEELLLDVDPRTGKASQLLRETDAAWLNIDPSVPRWLADGKSFLWSTERDGGWQLELRRADGSLVRALTPPELGYRAVLGVDESHGVVFVSASPKPTQGHVYRIPLGDQGRIEAITSEPGLHGAVFAKQGGVRVHSVLPFDGQPRWTVLDAEGTAVGELKSLAETPPFTPRVELTSVGDSPALQASLVRPKDFEPGKRYPVIVSVYGGPHSQMVVAAQQRYVFDQWIADRGYVVVSIDGRGTPSRGRQWERAIKGNLIRLPLEDQVRGLQALGKKYPELDLSRVGIYGWSFGGYFSAMAAMQRPDVFHAAVAGAPVADWRDYDTHYTERYLGLPEECPQAYEASSVLTYAAGLRRPLLIVHGTADDNVYFMHSLKMSNALFRAGRQHEFLPLAGFTHMVPDPLVTQRLYGRIVEFFGQHLLPAVSEAGR